MPGIYRNAGAKWRRDDGTVIGSGQEFEPTEDELLRKAYKLRYVRPKKGAPAAPQPAPGVPAVDPLEDYKVGKGVYLIRGEKVRGRTAALEALAEGSDDGQD